MGRVKASLQCVAAELAWSEPTVVRTVEQSRGSIVLVVTVTMSVAEKKQVWRKILGDFQEGQPLCSSSTSNDCVCFLTSFNKHSIDKTSSVNLLSTVKNHDQHTGLL